MIRTILLILGCISFVIVIGGATYEHAAIVPRWTTAVPASLSMFQGEYGLAAQNFWIPVHPITLALLSGALVANWSTDRRYNILIPLIGYLSILAVTAFYFVPELMALTGSTYSASTDAELTRRANNWEVFSLIRLAVLIGLAVVLLFGLSKPVRREV